jgi:hypothetical protein
MLGGQNNTLSSDTRSATLGGINNTINNCTNCSIISCTGTYLKSGTSNLAVIGCNTRNVTGGVYNNGIVTTDIWLFGTTHALSDERQKKNIQLLSSHPILPDPIETTKKIEPISFQWNRQPSFSNHRYYGFSAQNCEKAAPWLVSSKAYIQINLKPITDQPGYYSNIDHPEQIFNETEHKIFQDENGNYYTEIERDYENKHLNSLSIQSLSVLTQKKLIEKIEHLESEISSLKSRVFSLEHPTITPPHSPAHYLHSSRD